MYSRLRAFVAPGHGPSSILGSGQNVLHTHSKCFVGNAKNTVFASDVGQHCESASVCSVLTTSTTLTDLRRQKNNDNVI